MNSPHLSFEDTTQDNSLIKDRLASLLHFVCHVLIFLGGFIVIASIVLLIIYELTSIAKQAKPCFVNKTYPLDHGEFLLNATMQREGNIP